MKRSFKLFDCYLNEILKYSERNCTTKPSFMDKQKIIHPYRKIHPWNSVHAFSQYLVDNVIYNNDGLVAINKPYGITIFSSENVLKNNNYSNINKVAHSINYTISDALVFIAEKLGYSSLKVVKSPEKYISGLTLLAANEKVLKAVQKALIRGPYYQQIPTTYWIVTTKTPRQLRGKMRLALVLQESPCKTYKRPVILNSWSKNEEKRKDVKPFNVEFNLLSNSTQNLSSLIEISISTRQWHIIRLFAASILHSPVLGDNMYGSLIQNVMGKYINVGTFTKGVGELPKLNKELLNMLYLTSRKQELIPVHIHLRKICLMKYLKTKDLVIEAPLMPEFQWTYDTLKFKTTTNEQEDDFQRDYNKMKNEANMLHA